MAAVDSSKAKVWAVIVVLVVWIALSGTAAAMVGMAIPSTGWLRDAALGCTGALMMVGSLVVTKALLPGPT